MTTIALDAASAARSNAYRKTAWRLMPFLMPVSYTHLTLPTNREV